MPRSKMEQIKTLLDSSIAFIGVIVALIAVASWYAGKKVDAEKALEEERLKTRVSEANAEAARANESISKTDLKAQELELEVLHQKDISNTLSLELEKQKENTAKAEKELLLLQNKVKQRRIPEEKKDSIIQALQSNIPNAIKVSSIWLDGEARNYATEIANLFIAAGWETDHSGIAASALTFDGIILLNQNSTDNRINFLNDIFMSNDIDLGFYEKSNMPMTLLVGTKIINT